MRMTEMRDNLRKMPRPDVLAKKIIIDDSDTLVELVKWQMQQGVRGGVRKDVARLGWYTPKGGWQDNQGDSDYALMKHKKNPIPGLGIVDLNLTGEFYNAFYFDEKELEVTSSDSKTEDLKERYGKYIFKLTPDSIKQFRYIFSDKFFAYFRAFLAGNNPF